VPILCRREPHDLFEKPREVVCILKPKLKGDLFDLQRGPGQQTARFADLQMVKILHGGQAGRLLENAAEVERGQVGMPGHRSDIQRK